MVKIKLKKYIVFMSYWLKLANTLYILFILRLDHLSIYNMLSTLKLYTYWTTVYISQKEEL